MSKVDYLIKFDENGNRGETHDAAFMTDDKIKEYERNGFIRVSTADYMNLLGNNEDNQQYIRQGDGTFVPKPPYEPTQEELLQQEAATTKSKMMSMKDDLLYAMLKGENAEPIIANYAVSLTSISDDVAEKIPEIFPAWDGNGKQYKTGDRLEYNGVLYKVLQDHTSQTDWTPETAPSLFAKILTSDDGTPKEWQQPDSTNPYMKGDKVIYDGKVYESTIDNNVWSPADYPDGWKEITTEE